MATYDTVFMVAFKLIDVSVGFFCCLSPTSFVTGGEAITTVRLEFILVFTCNKLTV